MKISKDLRIVLLLIFVQIAAVLCLTTVVAPARKGNSVDFWYDACGINLGGAETNDFGGIYQPRDGWYIYYIQGWHGQFIFRLSKAQAIADFPDVIRRIRSGTSMTNTPMRLRNAAAVIENNSSEPSFGPDRFLALVRDAELKNFRDRDLKLYNYIVEEERAFDDRWTRIKHYWINVLFEIAFFSGLTLFTFMPWLRKGGYLSRGLHLGFFPFLLLLPYYCGYAQWTFTSAGPSGGILYPWVICLLQGFPMWTGADQWLISMIPKILEPISQSEGPMLIETRIIQ